MRHLVLLLSCFLLALHVHSNNRYHIVGLTNNDGLSNSSITTIFQDSEGLLWFGSWDGLNAYNSRAFKVYKPEVNNPHAISHNIIRDIVEQDAHTLWISTDKGLDRLNRKSDRFEHFFPYNAEQSPTREHSFVLTKDNHSRIFAQIHGLGIFYFDPLQQQFVLCYEERRHCKQIFFDRDNHLWVHVNKHLYQLQLDSQLQVVKRLPLMAANGSPAVESAFFNEANNELLLQTASGKVAGYRISNGQWAEYPAVVPRRGVLKSTLFFDTYQLWGTTEGLFVYDLDNHSLHSILPATQVLSLRKGSQQIIWVGTDMQGVYMLSPSHNNFYSYTSETTAEFGKKAVRCFLENEKNGLWVGTKGGGIFVFNLHHNPRPHYKQNLTMADGLLSNSVFTLVQGTGSEYWIGTDGGMNYCDARSNKVHTLKIPALLAQNPQLQSIYSILPQGDSTLWVGTSGYGMFRLEIDRSTQPYSIASCKQYVFDSERPNSLSNNIVYSIVADDSTHLWIGTRGGGLNRFNTSTEAFQAYRFAENDPHSINNDDILCLLKDASGALWVGTSTGLNKLEHFAGGAPRFSRFTENEGVPNNTIHGILEDRKHNLWVSTNRGIAKLILKDEQYRIISYFKKDGLQNNEFSDGAYYKSPQSSDLYFGGISGYSVFDPSCITDNHYMPPLVLEAFSIQNVETHLFEHLQTKNDRETLVLRYEHKSVNFKFVPLDYISGTKCEIAYQLEGYDKEWIQLGTSSTIVFSNLPRGSYVLKVRSSNADKIWSQTCFSLPIVMLPPWWASLWAYLCYALLLSGLIWVIHRQIKARITFKNNLRAKELEQQKTEEIHQAKLRFFTNIAHEFSNSLTLIYAPCEQLMTIHENDNARKYINAIRSNSHRMQSLIQQLIEFRKAETGFLNVKIETLDIVELIKFVIDNFIETLEQKKIALHLDFPPQPLFWNTDHSSFEKILFNLISNATKYTPQEQSIHIRLAVQDNHLLLQITNSGTGIRSVDKNVIFNRFKVLERFEIQLSEGCEVSSGIGLSLCKSIVEMLGGVIEVQSDERTYTTFVVRLPHKTIEAQSEPTIALAAPLSMVPESAPSALSRPLPMPGDAKGELVLVIDDDREIRLLLRDILSETFEVAEAADGREGLEVISNRMPAIIVCDVIMPNMNGVEFVQVMKRQEHTRHIPIILLSSKVSIESQIEGIETGADAYLPKPFHPRHLRALTCSLIGRNKAVTDFNKSHYAGLEPFQGKLIHREDNDLLMGIMQIIKKNIDEETLSLKYIANEMAISSMQLYRKIKELTGQSPTEFIRSLRLEQAEMLLKTTTKTVQEIMYCCGFNNKAYFYREFSKKYQLTPKEYRNDFIAR